MQMQENRTWNARQQHYKRPSRHREVTCIPAEAEWNGSPKITIDVASRCVAHRKRVWIHVPRIAHLTSIRPPGLRGCDTAQGKSHSFGNGRGERVADLPRNGKQT